VLLTGLEESDQPPIDVVDAHDLRIGRRGWFCDPRSPRRDTPGVAGHVCDAQAPTPRAVA
jgi:hypothetical protein